MLTSLFKMLTAKNIKIEGYPTQYYPLHQQSKSIIDNHQRRVSKLSPLVEFHIETKGEYNQRN